MNMFVPNLTIVLVAVLYVVGVAACYDVDVAPGVQTDKAYSDRFCLIPDKSCSGHDLDQKSENIQPYRKCLKKCAVLPCAGVDFDGECSPKSYECTHDELVHTPGTDYYVRLEEGVTKCPCKGGQDPITIKVEVAAPPNLTVTELTSSYCEAKNKECPGTDLESVFAADPQQCHARCNRNLDCLSAFYDENQWCHLRAERCSGDQLIQNSTGITYRRLKKKEECPVDQPKYVYTEKAYSDSFCFIPDKSCHGRNLYPNPWYYLTYRECLWKCAKIQSCAGVDYDGKYCSPKSNECFEDPLVNASGTDYYRRLEKNKTKCPCGEGQDTSDW